MALAIARTKKIKTALHLSNAFAHNQRSAAPSNVDPSRTPLNGAWETISGDPMKAVDDKIAELASTKIRRNKVSVFAFEFLLSASPEYFRPSAPERAGTWDDERLERWTEAARNWLFERYGNRIIDCRLHLDEATPHIQAIIVPITPDGRLSAKDLLSRQNLINIQTTYAKAIAHLGIQRGLEGSTAKHTSVSKFHAAIARDMDPVVDPSFAPEAPGPADLVRKSAYIQKQHERLEDMFAPTAARASLSHIERRRREAALSEAGRAKKAAREAEERAETARIEADRLSRDAAKRRLEQEEMRSELAEQRRALRQERETRQRAINEATASLRQELEQKRKTVQDQQRQIANQVRGLALPAVAERLGLDRDSADENQWLGDGLRVSLKGQKFFDHEAGKGGGGAIDFAAHVLACTPAEAIKWLAQEFGQGAVVSTAARVALDTVKDPKIPIPTFAPPAHHESLWSRVRDWLVNVRALAEKLVDELHSLGKIGADARGNFFALMTLNNKPAGAELKGTGDVPFTGLQRGSTRSAVFSTSDADRFGKPGDRTIVLTESAIDAISARQILTPDQNENFVFVSLAGARPRLPKALLPDLEAGSRFLIAFDADGTGVAMGAKLRDYILERGGNAEIFEPPPGAKDWNDALQRRFTATPEPIDDGPDDEPLPPTRPVRRSSPGMG